MSAQRLTPNEHYRGRAERIRWVGKFLVCRYYYAPGMHLDRHVHSGPFISVGIGGCYQEGCGRAMVTCKPGIALYHPPEELHSNCFDSGATILMLDLAEAAREAGVVDRLSPQRLEFAAASCLARQICREFVETCPTSDLIIESLAFELLADCLCSSRRGPRRTPPWLAAIVEIANDRFSDSLGLAEAAQMVGIHPMHLAREFHRRFGCTFGEFLRRVRLSRAQAQLRRTKNSIAEIAMECGFADQSHLTRLFAKAFGTTPARYRQSPVADSSSTPGDQQ